jgi:phenylalanyl-tRNA synthetase beta chain
VHLGDAGEVGWVGEVDPAVADAWGIQGRVGWLELDVTALDSARPGDAKAAPVSRFPSSDLDLAFVVDDSIPAGDVEDTLRAAGGDSLEWVTLFDVYRGPGLADGSRSLAFRLRFVALDRTLTDADLAELRRACIAAVESTHHATLRG